MSPLLIIHVSAGSFGIVSGAAAACVRKGGRLHRAFGTGFFLSMLTMSAAAVCIATLLPPTATAGAPPMASVAVGILTFYLVSTAWMTVRRRDGSVGRFERGALLAVLSVAAALLLFGLRQAHDAPGRPGGYVPYFVFAALAAFAGAMDLRVILRGGSAGVPRIARHLWRMSVALFFATAFFFVGQQKVMPGFVHGSPILLIPAMAPLALMVFWLFRIRCNRASRKMAAPG